MTTQCRARIRWLTTGEGGRTRPPPGPRYSTVARFDILRERWPKEAWSVVLDIDGPADDNGIMLVAVRMLAADAPAELMHPGRLFDLFEGRHRVAEGEVLPDA